MKNIITVGREYGSGGLEIAKKAAERLGYQFYDKELIAQIAEKTLLPTSFVESAEDPPVRRNIFHEDVPLFVNGDPSQTDYIFAEQGKFIVKLAEEGRCVICGRRADYYLRDNEHAMHLFFYADEDFKIGRISRMFDCSADEAIKKIRDMDRRRRTSYEYTTGRKWGDPHNYDRMICTSSLGIDRTVEEVVGMMG